MSYLIKRITQTPKSPIRILVREAPKDPNDKDAGLARGGSFMFYPDGSDEGESQIQVGAHAARAIMSSGMEHHFVCDPPLGGGQSAGEREPVDDDDDSFDE